MGRKTENYQPVPTGSIESPELSCSLAMKALDHVSDAVIFIDSDSRLTYANRAAEDLFAMPEAKLIGSDLPALYRRPATSLFYRKLTQALQQRKSAHFRDPVQAFNRWLEITMQPINAAVLICFRIVTPEIIDENVWMIAFMLTEKLKDMVLIVRSDGRIFYANTETATLLGYTVEELIHSNIHDLEVSQTPDSLIERWNQARQADTITYESRYRTRSGVEIPVEVSFSHLRYHGIEYGCIAARDIEERKAAEAELRRSNKEKELLLKEIHHRVKNNLQIISSLLSLQSSSPNKPDYADSFRQSENRIRSMALIHEKLYRSKDVSSVDFKEYVTSLVTILTRSYSVHSGVETVLEIEDISLDIDTAIPCGLIINELVSNSLKYAFREGQTGTIKISLVREDGHFRLTVADDGMGLPQGIDYRNTTSLGLELVVTLTEQISGEIKLDNSKGAVFTITFLDKGPCCREI